MDQGTLKVTLFFSSSLASGKSQKYLIAVFKHWLQSCKEFFVRKFCWKPHDSLWCTLAILWCYKLCAVFGPPGI